MAQTELSSVENVAGQRSYHHVVWFIPRGGKPFKLQGHLVKRLFFSPEVISLMWLLLLLFCTTTRIISFLKNCVNKFVAGIVALCRCHGDKPMPRPEGQSVLMLNGALHFSNLRCDTSGEVIEDWFRPCWERVPSWIYGEKEFFFLFGSTEPKYANKTMVSWYLTRRERERDETSTEQNGSIVCKWMTGENFFDEMWRKEIREKSNGFTLKY